jgi:hypothetical protein
MKTKFVSKYGQPITGAATNMKSLPVGGPDGSVQQAEGQIRNSPRPFGNPHLNPMQASGQVSAVTQQQRRQLGGMSAGGTKPRPWQSAQANSEPPSHNAMMTATGHKPGYAPKQGYSPVIGGRLKPGRTRVMRGAIPGAKPLVSSMSNQDFAAGMKSYQKHHSPL